MSAAMAVALQAAGGYLIYICKTERLSQKMRAHGGTGRDPCGPCKSFCVLELATISTLFCNGYIRGVVAMLHVPLKDMGLQALHREHVEIQGMPVP